MDALTGPEPPTRPQLDPAAPATDVLAARLLDPKVPWTQWLAGPLIALVLMRAAMFFGPSPALFIGALATFWPLLQPRPRPRDVTLSLDAGSVQVRGAGLQSQRIRGRKLKGATTAYTRGGVAVTLQLDRPVTLVVAGDAEAKRVLDALGVGHSGFGKIAWSLPGRGGAGTLRTGLHLVAWSTLFLAMTVLVDSVGLGVLAGMVLATGALVVGAGLLTHAGRGPKLTLDALGVGTEPHGPHIAYAAIRGVDVDPEAVTLRGHHKGEELRIPVGGVRLGPGQRLDGEQCDVLRRQIKACVARTQGLGPTAPEVPLNVADLARHGDGKAWLGRLDGVAERLASGGGYRGAALDEEELWRALENHDAPSDVRAAAARVLVRARPDTAPRVLRIAEGAREKATERRIRIATDPGLSIERAAEELDAVREETARV